MIRLHEVDDLPDVWHAKQVVPHKVAHEVDRRALVLLSLVVGELTYIKWDHAHEARKDIFLTEALSDVVLLIVGHFGKWACE